MMLFRTLFAATALLQVAFAADAVAEKHASEKHSKSEKKHGGADKKHGEKHAVADSKHGGKEKHASAADKHAGGGDKKHADKHAGGANNKHGGADKHDLGADSKHAGAEKHGEKHAVDAEAEKKKHDAPAASEQKKKVAEETSAMKSAEKDGTAVDSSEEADSDKKDNESDVEVVELVQTLSLERVKFIGKLLNSKARNRINAELPSRTKMLRLDPMPTVFAQPIMHMYNLTGLSALHIDEIYAHTGTYQNGNYQIRLSIKATLPTDLNASGFMGLDPFQIPVDVHVTNARYEARDVLACLDERNLALISLQFIEHHLVFENMNFISEESSFANMVNSILPKYRNFLQELMAARLTDRLEREAEKMLPIYLID